MKGYTLTLFFIFTILMSSCSNQQSIIMREDVEPRQDEPSVDLIDHIQESQNEVPDRLLEFRLDNQLITLNVDRIPILSNYLAQHADLDQVTQGMELIPVMPDQHNTIFLLAFACNNQTCSYLLINTEKDESQLLADQAKLVEIIPSPDSEKVIFIFNRNFVDSPRYANKLIVYNLQTWQEHILTETESENKHMGLHAFRWPILNVEWFNDSEIMVELPDIEQSTITEIQAWFESDERPINELMTSID